MAKAADASPDWLAELAEQPLWFVAFIGGLGVGSALGSFWTLKRVGAFFGPEEMGRLKAAERGRLALLKPT